MNFDLKDKSIILLIAVNLLPLVGVFVFGWDALMIVMFYCIETFLIGIFNVFKMIRSEGEIPQEHMQDQESYSQINQKLSSNPGCIKGVLIPFFIVHYNGFVIIQAIMIYLISNQFSNETYEFENFLNIEFLINILLLAFSHAYSYKKKYIGSEEYKKASVTKLMIAPYKRVFVQQFTVLAGTFFIILFQGPLGFLILLIILKIIMDVRAHKKSHKSFEDEVEQYIKNQKEKLNR